MNKIQMALSNFGARLFRNQVGTYTMRDGSVVKSGLGPGSSDLIGFTTVQIQPKMVGHKVAVFTAVEVKTPKGRVSDKQNNFLQVVKRSGGIGFVARSTKEAIDKLFKESTLANGSGL